MPKNGTIKKVMGDDSDIFDELLGKKPKRGNPKETEPEDEEYIEENESEEDSDKEEMEEDSEEESEEEESEEKDSDESEDEKDEAEIEKEEPEKEESEEEDEPEKEEPKGDEEEESDEESGEDEEEESEEDEEGEDEEGEDSGDEEESDDDKAEDEEEKPSKEKIKETIFEKSKLASEGDKTVEPVSGVALNFLEDPDNGNVFIGRKKNIYKKYGYEAALHVGRVREAEHKDSNVFLDGLNPHVVFVCGARGSGKSYVLGVMAEELALKNKNVGVVVIDPIGVFWSMKFPNREEKELDALTDWGIMPQGLDNLKVFVPDGVRKEVPKSTYDAGFSLLPSMLTGEDWCLTFGIDRFGVTGLLLDRMLKKVEDGYKQTDTNKKVKGKNKNYSVGDMVECLETDAELNSREHGYKQDSIRALVSRFEAAKTWGIFSDKGTPLSELSREGQLTILDTSFLEDNVTALVIGILARRALTARKISTRKEASNKFKALDVKQLLELEIPPTWIIIDEAHTLIPGGNEKTPATNALVEYVKQGRRPGCSLVFATQQPSAINTKVLSQIDVIISHKLVFDDDIKAVYKRTPTIIPSKYKKATFIKTLPVGVALVGDRREETSRAFIMKIRPRMSQHEGRDAETTERSQGLSDEQVKKLATEMIYKDLMGEGEIDLETAEQAVETLNRKYRSKVSFNDVTDLLKKKEVIVGEDSLMIPGTKHDEELVDELTGGEEEEDGEEEEESDHEEKEDEKEEEEASEEVEDEETTELLALPQRIVEERAKKILNGIRKKKFLGLIGEEEEIANLQLKYATIWRVRYDVFNRKNEFLRREAFINSLTGEFLHMKDGKFEESKGLSNLMGLGKEEVIVFKELVRQQLLVDELMNKTNLSEGRVRRILNKLIERGLVKKLVEKKSGKVFYTTKDDLDLPPNERTDLLQSLNKLPFVKSDVLAKEKEEFEKNDVIELLQKLWGNVVVKEVDALYRPLWIANLTMKDRERIITIDGLTGAVLSS
ncbi:MAG: helicase HerA-like domain-containing protein [Candidatus Diapherotrites archaeon]